MSLNQSIGDYLEKCGSVDAPPLNAPSLPLGKIRQVVVIPALAEKSYLFSTLASLARNDPGELEGTLVICVINNRPYPFCSRESILNNVETLELLANLGDGRLPFPDDSDEPLQKSLREIHRSELRLAYLDASSPGREMPQKKGGVGLARKWGLDAGLSLLESNLHPETGRLLCLDADSPVDNNYLSAVRRFYETHPSDAAVISYAHPFPEDPQLKAAICSYEIFLRYYVLGLSYAESPYAFHTIGSTMSCTVRGYMAVRGMNRREAGEDFYFLNKLAKLSPMGKITETRVYPSARPSARVPFGTGRKMQGCLEGEKREDVFYDPRVFFLLRQWLTGMKNCIREGGGHALQMAGEISPHLLSFLKNNDFSTAWERICKTHKDQEKRLRHFHEWFDAFKTLKLIHHLKQDAYPSMELWHALPELLARLGRPLVPLPEYRTGSVPGLEVRMEVLDQLRRLEAGVIG